VSRLSQSQKIVEFLKAATYQEHLLDFADLREQIGFDDYHSKANELNNRGK